MPDNGPKPASSAAATEPSSAESRTDPGLLADYARTDQLAIIFNVSSRTIERWTRLKLLPAPLKLGRKRLHHIPSIRKRLADRTVDNSQGRRKS
jgi:hypothetical protein